MNENLKSYYDYMTSHNNEDTGVRLYEGSYDDFVEDMSDNDVRLSVYNYMTTHKNDKGALLYDGDITDFDFDLGFNQEETTPMPSAFSLAEQQSQAMPFDVVGLQQPKQESTLLPYQKKASEMTDEELDFYRNQAMEQSQAVQTHNAEQQRKYDYQLEQYRKQNVGAVSHAGGRGMVGGYSQHRPNTPSVPKPQIKEDPYAQQFAIFDAERLKRMENEVKTNTESIESEIKNLRQSGAKDKVWGSDDDMYLDIAEALDYDANKIIKAGKKYDPTSGWNDFWNATLRSVWDADVATLGGRETRRMMNLIDVVEKIDRNEKLTQAEEIALKSFANYLDAQDKLSSYYSVGTQGGNIAGESLPFMIEMMITAGIGGAAKRGIVKGLVKAGKESLAKKVGAALGGVALQGATTLNAEGNLVANAVEYGVAKNLGGKALQEVGKTAVQTMAMGSTHANIQKDKLMKMLNGEEYDGLDWTRSFTNAFMETATERIGGKVIDKAVGKIVPKYGKLNQIWGKIHKNSIIGDDYINGFAGEYGEEVLNAIASEVRSWNPLYSDEENAELHNEFMHFFSEEGATSTAIGLLPMSVVGSIAHGVGYVRNARKYRQAVNRIQNYLVEQGATQEQAQDIIRGIESSENDESFLEHLNLLGTQMGIEFLRNNPEATKEEINAYKERVNEELQNYFDSAREYNDSLRDLEAKFNELPHEERTRIQTELEDRIQDGRRRTEFYRGLNEKYGDMDAQFAEQHSISVEDLNALRNKPETEQTIDDKALLDEYYQFTHERNKEIHAFNEANKIYEERRQEIENNVNRTNGRLQNVKVGAENEESVVRLGNINYTINDEGNYVIDFANSDQIITVVNEDGTNPRQVSIHDITLVSDVSASDAKQIASEEATNRVDSEMKYRQGSVIVRNDGLAGEVVSILPNGNVMVANVDGSVGMQEVTHEELANWNTLNFTQGQQVGSSTIEQIAPNGAILLTDGSVVKPRELAFYAQLDGINLNDLIGQAEQIEEAQAQVEGLTEEQIEQAQVASQLEQDVKYINDMIAMGDDSVLEDTINAARQEVEKLNKKKPKATEPSVRMAEMQAIKAERDAAQAKLDRWLAVQDAIINAQQENNQPQVENNEPRFEVNQENNVNFAERIAENNRALRETTSEDRKYILLEERRKLMQDYLNAQGKTDAVVLTAEEFLEYARNSNWSEENKATVEEHYALGRYVDGCYHDGKILITSDAIFSIAHLDKVYNHESIHVSNDVTIQGQQDVLDLVNAFSRETLRDAVQRLSGSTAYNDWSAEALADEVIAFTSENPNLPVGTLFARKGIRNNELLTQIQRINEQRRTNPNLYSYERGAYGGQSNTHRNRIVQQTQGRESRGDQRTQTSQSSNQNIAEQIIPNQQVGTTSEVASDDVANIGVSGVEDTTTRFRIRESAAPIKTKPVYKLMRLGADNKLYPLYIDSTMPVKLGVWYDADSPNLGDLKNLPSGIHAIDQDGNAISWEEYAQANNLKGKKPNAKIISETTQQGLRWMSIVDKKQGQKRYGGESRSYYNLGINGSGQVGEFAMRPGWHAGSLPTMRQIGKGANKDLRDDNFVWVEGRVSADMDYQKEAENNPDKDIPTHIPTDGYYLKATNANKDASQADVVGWYVAGSFVADRIISDKEARQVIDTWNAEHPDQQVMHDFLRESGLDFDAETMSLVDPQEETKRESIKQASLTDGAIEVGGEESEVRFSVSANFTGAGFIAKDVEGNHLEDANGNLIVQLGNKVFNGHNPITFDDIKTTPSVLNKMLDEGVKLGNITLEKADIIRQKYVDILNKYLTMGLAENGGFSGLQQEYMWLGETIFKTIASNSDKQYSTSADITRVCKKNEAVIKAISALQLELGYGITPSQVMDIYLESYEQGYQVPCPVCYVFSRYVDNGVVASAIINGMRKYRKHMKGQEQEWTLKQWQKEWERLEAQKDKFENSAPKKKMQSAIEKNLKQIDDLGLELMTTKDVKRKKEIEKEIRRLDEEYRAALDLWSQQRLTTWITSFVLTANKKAFREDMIVPTDMADFERHALDLRLTAQTMVKYPSIQAFRKAGGSSGGKEITFASDNALGDLVIGLNNVDNMESFASLDDKKQESQIKSASGKLAQQKLRGGQRMWSWSDNIESLMGDIAINLMQIEMLGGALQTYSKQLEGINLVARMGGYVNGSLMAKGKGYEEVTEDQIEVVNGIKRLKNAITETISEPTLGGRVERTRTLADKGSQIYEQDGKNYVLIYDDIVGIDPYGRDGKKGLFDLNRELDKAGNIIVGINDTHNRIAMADDNIFFIIPWHSSGAKNHILAQMFEVLNAPLDTENMVDYTDMQSEKDVLDKSINPKLNEIWEGSKNETDWKCGIKGGVDSTQPRASQTQKHYRELRDAIFGGTINQNKEWLAEVMADEFLSQVYDKVNSVAGGKMTAEDKAHIYPYEYWDMNSTFETADVNGARYLEYCRRLGFQPKFCGIFGENNTWSEVGDFHKDKGYWKLLIDRRMYDTKGNFQDLTTIDSDGFSTDLIDSKKNRDEFFVSQVANDQATENIVKNVIAKETERTGTMPSVNYNTTLEDAKKAFQDVRFRISRTEEEFESTQREAVEKKGIVMPNLNNLEVEIVNVPRHDFTGDLKNARKEAREWATKNYSGKLFALPNNDGVFEITSNAIKKYLDKSSFNVSDNSKAHLSALKRLPEIIEKSVEGEIHADYKKIDSERSIENGIANESLLVHRYFGAINIDGVIYRVKTTLNEFKGFKNIPHSYELSQIELIEDSSVSPNKEDNGHLNRSTNSISTAKLLKNVEKSYDKGKKLLDESQDIDIQNDIRFRFIGEIGAANLDKAEEATTRLDNLAVARQMEEAKKDAKSIKMATGWERGADGKWRYETEDIELIDDFGYIFSDSKKPFKLKDIIKDEELFKAYPHLANVKIKRGQGYGGGSWDSKNTITLHNYSLKTIRGWLTKETNEDKYNKYYEGFLKLVDETKRTLIHEIQHAIQDYEGFAVGGSENTLNPNSDVKGINELRERVNTKINEFNGLSKAERVTSEGQKLKRETESLISQYRRIRKQNAIGELGYKRLAGEVEARNAEKRSQMTIEDRMQSLASETEDVAREDQIFIYDAIEDAEKAISGTVFSGGGLIEAGLEGLLEPQFAIEYDEKIAGVYANNHGNHILVADIRDVDIEDLASNVEGTLDYFHASPVCKRYSTMNMQKGEVELDVETAQATADVIRAKSPKVVTIENVPRYKDSKAMGIITDALNDGGYTWDANVYDASDYGSATSRKRLIIRATNVGELPSLPQKVQNKVGWYDVVSDLIDELPTSELAQWQVERLKKDGIDPTNIKEPLFVFDGGQPNGKARYAWASQPLPTILASGSADRIVMPNGEVKLVSPRVLARIMGLPDSYELPNSRKLAHTILGNGVPTELTKAVISPMLEQFQDEPYSAVDDVRFRTSGDASYVGLPTEHNDHSVQFRIQTEIQKPIFVSNAQLALDKIKQEKATPQQWLAMLEKNAGIKAGEDKWLGLSDWLKENKSKSLTKQEIAEYIAENSIVIEEVWYGEIEFNPFIELEKELLAKYPDFNRIYDWYNYIDGKGSVTLTSYSIDGVYPEYKAAEFVNRHSSFAFLNPNDPTDEEIQYLEDFGKNIIDSIPLLKPIKEIDETRIAYVTKGLNSYQEVALTIPTIDSWNQYDEVHFGDAGDGRAVAWVRFGETTDADGNRVLVIDEIQSKRHQEGREKGYQNEFYNKFLEEVYEARREWKSYQAEMDKKYYPYLDGGMTQEEVDKLDSLFATFRNKQDDFAREMKRQDSRIPDAPFEKNWQELAFKRMLRYATENGFDKIAWTKGEQQAKRYNIKDVVRNIEVGLWQDEEGYLLPYGTERKKEYLREVDLKLYGERSDIFFETDGEGVIHGGDWDGQNLSDVVGKEIAKGILDTREGSVPFESLEFGGEGMKGFYDKMLPSFIDKYGKKWGVKTKDITLPKLEEAGRVMHSIDVTDEMRQGLEAESQPMFRVVSDPTALQGMPTQQIGETFKDYLDRYKAWRDAKVQFESALNVQIPEYPRWDKDKMTLREYIDAVKEYNDAMIDAKASAEFNKDFIKAQSKWGVQMQSLFDNMVSLRKFQQWMQKNGVNVDATTDAYNDSFMRNSRAQYALATYQNGVERVMLENMRDIFRSKKLDGISLRWHNIDSPTTDPKEQRNGTELTDREKLDVYVQAKDIIEARALGLPDRGEMAFMKNLGFTPYEVVAMVEAELGLATVNKLWTSIRNVNKYPLDYMLQYGLIDQATYDEYQKRQYYVPERGWKERDFDSREVDYMPNNKGGEYSTYNPALVKAKGRSSLASSPFPYMRSIAHSSILAAEKMRTKQAFLKLLLQNEKLGIQSGAYKIRRAYSIAVKDANGNTMLDAEGNPINEVVYEAPTAQMREHDQKVYEQMSSIRRNINSIKNRANTQIEQLDDEINRLQASNQPYAQAEIAELKKRKRAIESNAINNINQLNKDLTNLENSKYIVGRVDMSDIKQRTNAEKKQHMVLVTMDGVDYVIELNSEHVANAINGNIRDVSKMEGFKWVAKGTQFLSSMKTQYNYEFAFANFARDFALSSMINQIRHGGKFALKANGEVFSSMGMLASYLINGHDVSLMGDYKDKDILKQFLESGALTGFSFSKPIGEVDADIEKALRDLSDYSDLNWKQKVAKFNSLFWDTTGDSLAFLSELSEMSVRYAQFATCVKNGMSVEQAAIEAKNITTNFDRKGVAANYAGWLYGFFNAGLQGVTNIAYAVSENPKQGAKVLSIWGASLVGLGYLTTRLFAPDDPDDEYYMTEWDRLTNFLIPTVNGVTIKIPMPHILRAFNAMGVNMALAEQGRKSWYNAIYDSMTFYLDELIPSSPLQIQNFWDFAEDKNEINFDATKFAQASAPTFISPFVDVWTDRNFMNTSVNKRKWDDELADSENKKATTPMIYQYISNFIKDATGGRSGVKYDTSGWDINPTSIEHIVKGYIGGAPQLGFDMGNLIYEFGSAVYDASRGEGFNPDIKVGELPFVRKVIATPKEERAFVSEYWDLKNKTEHLTKQYKQALKDNDTELIERFKEAGLIDGSGNIGTLGKANALVKQMKNKVPKGGQDAKIKNTSDDVKRLMELNAQLNKIGTP